MKFSLTYFMPRPALLTRMSRRPEAFERCRHDTRAVFLPGYVGEHGQYALGCAGFGSVGGDALDLATLARGSRNH